ncbi:hypothetical protein EON64_20650, partial [archaeon]
MSTRSKRKRDDNKCPQESIRRSRGGGEEEGLGQNDSSDDPLAPSGPFVFYCTASPTCRNIIGDSYSIVSSNEKLKTVSLRRASHVTRQEVLKTSMGKQDADQGATFFPIDCEQCKKIIGRYYITTPRELDEVRNCLTFFVDKLSSYVLGEGQIGDEEGEGE